MYDNECLGYMLINEAVDYNRQNVVNNITSVNDNSLFYITFDTNLQDFDVLNRNRRMYDGDNVMDNIDNDERIQSLLRTNGWFGEWSHPISEYKDKQLSEARISDVPPSNRAFKIMNPKRVSNVLTAKIQTACNDIGESFAKEVLAGWIPQFSVRALAKMTNRNGKPYVHVHKLITYDAPWYPSHKIAEMTGGLQTINKNIKASPIIESAEISLNELIKDVSSDSKIEAILESFDLNVTDISGISNDRRHVIINDNNNKIYAGVNIDTVNRINDFYNSF